MEKRGLRWYGYLGMIIITLMEINFFLSNPVQPFANWYFPIIWFGYILTIDAFVLKINGKSLINNRFSTFFGMMFISSLFWFIFEFTNLRLRNWTYSGIEGISAVGAEGLVLLNLFGFLSFATVLPALFETTELIRSLKVFEKVELKKSRIITKGFLNSMIIIGIISLILSLAIPGFAFPLIWISFFFILDPINYIRRQPCIIQHLVDRKLAIPLSLLLAGIIMGFLWEFWNFWAIPKWTYNVPFVGFFKIFEMPIVGYLGYLPFSWELYDLYWFVRSLFRKKEALLSE